MGDTMEQKLERLLNHMNWNDLSLFQGGSIVRIIGNPEKTKYRFVLHIKQTLAPEVEQVFQKSLQASYVGMETDACFQVDMEDETFIKEYYRSFLEMYETESPLFGLLKESPIHLSGGILIVTLNNKAEEMKFRSILSNLKKRFLRVGYTFDFQTVLDEAKSEEFQKTIKQELVINVPKEVFVSKEPEPEQKKKFIAKDYKRPPIIEEPNNPEVVIGRKIEDTITRIDTVISPCSNLTVEAYLFADPDVRETKTSLKIVTLKITDYTDSIYGKIFIDDEENFPKIMKQLKKGKWFKMRGMVKDDKYSNELTFQVRDINLYEKQLEEVMDDAPEKRVELHAHTMMSQMDGVSKLDSGKHTIELVEVAHKWGHKAIAITDHNGCQAFPIAFSAVNHINKKIENPNDRFKVIYGTELTMVDDTIRIVVRPTNTALFATPYVVFDLETTGFNAGGGDSTIEIGAVKLFDGEIIDRFDQLINPGRKLPPKITELTAITDEMLIDKPSEEEAFRNFMDWVGDLPMVAHNAKFDTSFVEMAYQKYHFGTFQNTVIDTLELSRTLDNNYARHSLSALVKRYNVPFDEDSHHRGDYDAEATAIVFHKMMKKLHDRNFETIADLDQLVSKDEIHKYGRTYHVNLLAKNKVGLKNLFRIISLANTTYLYKTPRILRSELNRLREGILIGSGCYESEVFIEGRSKSSEELTNIINFYDYVEVQPPEVYDHLLQMGDFGNKTELEEHLKKIVAVTEESGKIMVATGDVHQTKREDKIYREIIVNQKVPGGGRHPLSRSGITSIPSQHFRTTREMLDDFAFLGAEKAFELVVKNTNLVADQIEEIEVIIDTNGIPFSPKIENSVETVNELVYGKAKEWYGDPLPAVIEERINQELTGIIKGGFDVIYLIAQKLVKKSNDDGYLVGSRGSVGSSFVATMMGITEVNPLPAHYRCPNCKTSIFELDGKVLGADYSSGFDLPDLNCPSCSTLMIKDGQDMPFATFLGFDADKVPDIDLNFSDLNQADAHDYTKVLFGVDNVYRAGTIGTVAEKTAYGYVKGYCEDHNIVMRSAEIERLAMGCTGVKRTTGQHPGGIVVIPGYMDVFDFTPFQYPADDPNSAWRTTHFDYHAIDQDVLKLDILGHSDPTQLRMIQDLTGMDVTTVPLDDKETMGIFLSPEPLGVTKEQIMCETGTLGIPEFGTKFTLQMLTDTKPKTFAELIKISGLSHGTDVWLGNAQDLIRDKVVPFKEVIGCRDDIMVYLMYHGLAPKRAFKIMEFVRKGRATKEPDAWKEMDAEMREAGIEPWYIESCRKIKYMFPKAHAAAYVISAFRIAWYKVHMPVYYYASWLSTKATDYDVDAMISGYAAIKNKIIEIANKGNEATNKEAGISECLHVALEATARGIKFANIDLYHSNATTFAVKDETTIYPPFSSIDGLGDTVAKNIVLEREKQEFLSIEDFQKRAKVSTTLIEKMRIMGIFEGMDESSQLSLF